MSIGGAGNSCEDTGMADGLSWTQRAQPAVRPRKIVYTCLFLLPVKLNFLSHVDLAC
jgi:hypothetical protein